jgi:hypothetical protein
MGLAGHCKKETDNQAKSIPLPGKVANTYYHQPSPIAAVLVSGLPDRGTPAALTLGVISQSKAGSVLFLAVGVR